MDQFVESKGSRLIPILIAKKYSSNGEEIPLNIYMLRMSPLDRYTLETCKEWLASFTDNWILGVESSKKDKEHYHCTLYVPMEEQELRDIINKFLSIQFPEPPKRGDANKRYNLACVSEPEKAAQYSIKENNEHYGKNINPKYIEDIKKKAFAKFDKGTIAKELEALKAEFKINNKITIADFMIKFVDIKAKYRQPISLTYIHQLATSCECNRNPDYSTQIVSEFLSKISRWN